MHQPYYTDPVAGLTSLPWVRLHATKAYYDMAWLIERFPAIRATFNLTPSLLIQLKELASGQVGDLFLQYAQRPAADLTLAERAFLIRHFFSANWSTMVRPFPRYHELLVKRGLDIRHEPLDRLATRFSVQDLRDLQVWHNLAWFGFGMTTQYPELNELRVKGRDFSEDDKAQVLALQQQAIREVIPRYRRLAESGQIELTTSPFYHPILPLLIDTEIARRARPDARLPSRFQAPDDALAQIRKAVALHQEVFGLTPAGLWPSEGSVCPELIPFLHQTGLRWTATDEGVLARSLRHWNRGTALYRPYVIGPAGQEVHIVFRDRELSDAVGFVYAKRTPESAVEDLMRRLAQIQAQALDKEILIPIILDGENPWESYHGGGEQFLSHLYTELSKVSLAHGHTPTLVTSTIRDALEAYPQPHRLESLHSGSWVNQDFAIWIGHPEDNQAWELLNLTRTQLAAVASTLPPEQARAAWEELYAAEGSDWWWWYGDEFATDYKPEFDRLFRTHLRNVFIRAGLPVPDQVNDPISSARELPSFRQPVALLDPTIDGLVTDFFEWRGAGMIDPVSPLGTMWKAQQSFEAIWFGFSLDVLFLRLDPHRQLLNSEGPVDVECHISTASGAYKLAFSLTPPPVTFTLFGAANGTTWAELGRYSTICRRTILELAVPFKALQLYAGQAFRLSVVVLKDGAELDRYPRQSPVPLTVPDDTYEATRWRV
jgi:alpha-amylase/alpha-mannosidase (GH57 family)